MTCSSKTALEASSDVLVLSTQEYGGTKEEKLETENSK